MRKLLRELYYMLFSGRVVLLKKPASLKGYRWKINTLAGRSYWKGYYEPTITSLISQHLTKESVFFDIGANVGYFSLLAAVCSSAGSVHSFEPDKHTLTFSKSIKQLNQLSNWTINNEGVGETTETLYYKTGPTTTTGTIVTGSGVPIKITSVDDYVKKKQLDRVDMIKIDVEGFGGYVLRGAVDTIAKYQPIIIMEIHKGTDEKASFKKLVLPNYNIFDISGQAVDDAFAGDYDFVYAIPRA